MIADVLSVYGDEVAPYKRTARNIGYKIGKLLEFWGSKRVSEISPTTCREYVAARGTSSGAAADLKTLKAAVTHWHDSDKYGPLTFVPKVWRPDDPPPRERWLTRDEAARLLKAAKKYRHLRRFIILGLYTGSRPGVLLDLEWSQIDMRAGVLMRSKGPQARNKKAPNVKIGRRLMGHIRRWHKIDGGKGYICAFEGPSHPGLRRVEDPHWTWRKVVEAAGLKDVKRHTLRHTRATWMAQAGVPLFEAAGFLGMSTKTLERTYAHHDPAHQEKAANI